MPIQAKCRACGAQFKVVDSAAGRRVKCRACKTAFYLPGEQKVLPALSDDALAELESTGHMSQSEREAMVRYQAVVSLIPPEQRRQEETPVKESFVDKMKSKFKKQ